MKNLRTAKTQIINDMKKSGVMNSIDLRIKKHNNVATSLGYKNAQEAFNSLGKEFLVIANA